MKVGFLISGIIEILGAITMFVRPDLFFGDAIMPISKLNAIAALSIGIINMLCWRNYEATTVLKHIYLLMLFFHGAIAMTCYSLSTTTMPLQFEGAMTHLGAFIIMFLGYMKDIK